jgi:hypothetical protein
MTWGAVASTGLSIAGSFLGGSKEGERDAEDAQAAAMRAQENARRESMAALAPYLETGSAASQKLAQMLGVADPEGYADRPTLQAIMDQQEMRHFNKFGTGYDRNSNIAKQRVRAEAEFKKQMEAWEAGKAEYLKNNPGSEGDGSLLRAFSNEDFVKDPGYEFRQAEGEKGITRQLAKMGSFNSGAALKAIDRYNQDYASNEFNNAYNRDAANKARTFSFLSGSAGQGLQAAGAATGVNQNATNANQQAQLTTANNLYQMGQNREDNQFNAITSAIGNGIYAWERNKPVTGSTAQTGGYSSPPPGSSIANPASKPWYLS